MADEEKDFEREPTTRQGQLESREGLGEEGEPTNGGRAGGTLQKKKGTQDEEKRATERPAGVTRVRKADEKEKTTPQRNMTSSDS
ncbi:hypothetical protein [Aquisalinus flavus]|uniref:Uncharacterized protein n=1 Tax=Aquisalinus flavus TaxID=1526572 RepID=A0A8J2V4V4_9PROT|nr:hypothetical protein [Aquisalinus flavus]MBD0427868.1 hypothetical protein [Aquisalinus flavus]UNE47631.1 hypothetical protein FF099_05975 [Aquisalinus flavus]GGD04512.1 hypothetical protein GCM10011342_11850 [Aquisalinus flavus]